MKHPKFRYLERVTIVAGFHRGFEGVITGIKVRNFILFKLYRYKVSCVKIGEYLFIPESDLLSLECKVESILNMEDL